MQSRRSWPEQNEDLPVDVYPCSNGEFLPPAPTEDQRRIMALAESETERWRRRFGMSRRQFVRTSAAMAIGMWAVNSVTGLKYGRYALAHNTETTDACDLEWDEATGKATLQNLPGEFVFDVQSHHVDPEGLWRVNNPAFHAVFTALWPQAGPLGGRPGVRSDGSVRGFGAGELDPIQNLSRFHYFKELYLDSATTMTVLSAVPSAPDLRNPLPIAEAAETVQMVNEMARSQRCVMHSFVMPNRGSAGNNTEGYGLKPVFLQEELDEMEARAELYGSILRGWKVYCPWGDVSGQSGWFLDSEDIGLPFLQKVQDISNRYPHIPPVVAAHKGFALPGFDQRSASPKDVGPAAKAFPGIRFLIYHSGHDTGEGPQRDYAGDANVDSAGRSVDALIKTLRVNGLDAPANGGNSPNVYAELGSVWRDYMGDVDSAAHLVGKLIKHVGPKRVIWGTDSLWYGSPHREIVALRMLEMTQETKELYGLPYGLDGDVDDPTVYATDPARSIRNGILGRNAARAYNIDADAARNAIACDAVREIRTDYVRDAGTALERAEAASNQMLGARTPAELIEERRGKPWAP